jgi:hypothetical protein
MALITTTYQVFQSWLSLAASSLGIYGSIWVIYVYFKGKSLSSIIGILVTAMAVSDLMLALGTAVQEIFLLSFGIQKGNQWISSIFNGIVIWSMLSEAQLNLTLACIVFYLLWGGSLHSVQNLRCYLAIAGIFGPIIYWFLPFRILQGNEFLGFKTVMHHYVILSYVVLVIVGISTVLYLVIWRKYRDLKRKKLLDSTARVYRLVNAFLFSLIITWIPWLVRNFIFYNPFNHQRYAQCFMFFNPCSIWILLETVFVVSRGYVHALAINYVFEDGNSNSRGAICRFLLLNKLYSQGNQLTHTENYDLRNTISPKWEITGDC